MDPVLRLHTCPCHISLRHLTVKFILDFTEKWHKCGVPTACTNLLRAFESWYRHCTKVYLWPGLSVQSGISGIEIQRYRGTLRSIRRNEGSWLLHVSNIVPVHRSQLDASLPHYPDMPILYSSQSELQHIAWHS